MNITDNKVSFISKGCGQLIGHIGDQTLSVPNNSEGRAALKDWFLDFGIEVYFKPRYEDNFGDGDNKWSKLGSGHGCGDGYRFGNGDGCGGGLRGIRGGNSIGAGYGDGASGDSDGSGDGDGDGNGNGSGDGHGRI